MMTDGLRIMACLALVACGPDPAMIVYAPRQPAPQLGGKLVISPPYDDRYDAERDGETLVIKFAIGFFGGAYSSSRGNEVTSDHDFAISDGPFGDQGTATGIGNTIYAAFANQGGGAVVADRQRLGWRCSGGTCIPDAHDVVAAAARQGARYVLAARVVHLYGVRFGERQFAVASYTERRGGDLYQVNQVSDARAFSAGFGNCVIELSLFEVQGGAIVHTSRRSFAANRSDDIGAPPQAHHAMASLAVQALGDVLDAVRASTGAGG